jgi:hypothetical protein
VVIAINKVKVAVVVAAPMNSGWTVRSEQQRQELIVIAAVERR